MADRHGITGLKRASGNNLSSEAGEDSDKNNLNSAGLSDKKAL